jgi:hypothetical protein
MHAATLLVEALAAKREGRLAFLGIDEYRNPGGDGTG